MKVKVITIFILFILMILWGVMNLEKMEGLRIFFWKPATGVPAITVILVSFVVGIIVGGLLATLGRAEKITKAREEREVEQK
ncbi:MAG TPA: DUF1049 domain-containing protein [bacterium (Candidatus Stahlbacteria)]|nr:DUF1049 domain-containing protein [Candidatus Stahlbacteria bacterium]